MTLMSKNVRKSTHLEIIIKYLRKKIPKLDEIVLDLGFFTFDELVKCVLGNRGDTIRYSEAEKLVLAYIVKSLGLEPISDRAQDLKNQIKSIYEKREFLVNIIRKNKIESTAISA